MRAILIDDERLALDSMGRMLEKHGVEIAGTFQDPRIAVREAAVLDVDVAFVDIELPGINGLEAAEILKSTCPDIDIIFVTAYDHYAVKAFELNAADYLLKPVHPRRLENALARVGRSAGISRQEQAAPRLNCFHHLSFQSGNGQSTEFSWRTAKAKELFAYLVHARGLVVTKEDLLDLLWPEAELERGLTNLHAAVYQVRKTLKTAGFPIHILYIDGAYRLELNGVTLDIDDWASGLEPSSNAKEKGTDADLQWLKLYRGDYFEQEGYLWAENERERLRLMWLEAAAILAVELEKDGHPREAIELYKKIQERYPFYEDVYFWLMRIYDSFGSTAEVLAQYDKLCQVCEDELGSNPRADIAAWFEEWNNRRSR